MGKQVTFGYIGNIVPHKGLGLLVDVFKGLKGACLRIYGKDDQTEATLSFFKSLDIDSAKNIDFMGPVPSERVISALKSIDVLVVPSLWEEVWGLVIDEAKSMDVPVIASNIGAIPEHLIDGEEGMLFRAGDIEDLKRCILRIIENPRLLDKFRGKLKTPVSIKEYCLKLENLYGS